MPTTLEVAVRAALAPVEEPELRRGLGELGLVRGVAIDGATVAVAIADPLPDWGHWDGSPSVPTARSALSTASSRLPSTCRRWTRPTRCRSAGS